MTCNSEKIIHWLNGQLSKNEQQELETHFLECSGCQQELAKAKKAMMFMEQIEIPEPDGNMQLRFQTTLQNYKQNLYNKRETPVSFLQTVYQQLITRPVVQFGYSLLLVVVGFGVAYLLMNKPPKDNTKQELVKLSNEIKDMKQVMMLSLIENSRATERIKAVGYTNEINNVNSQVIATLFTTLNEDPNVNVRLVALDALVKYSHISSVREGLVQSITMQRSPLLQAALADVMIKLQEKNSVKLLKQLLQKNGVNNPAKQKIEKAIIKLSA